ncbi:hypothetical protein, partial [Streptomyces atratus]
LYDGDALSTDESPSGVINPKIISPASQRDNARSSSSKPSTWTIDPEASHFRGSATALSAWWKPSQIRLTTVNPKMPHLD